MHNGNITGYREHVSNAVNLCQMLNMCQHLIMCHWNLNMGQMLSNVSNCVNFLTLFTCEKELQIVSQYSSDRNLLSAEYVPDIILLYIYALFKPFPHPLWVHKACRTSMTRD